MPCPHLCGVLCAGILLWAAGGCGKRGRGVSDTSDGNSLAIRHSIRKSHGGTFLKKLLPEEKKKGEGRNREESEKKREEDKGENYGMEMLKQGQGT